jgi:hypothetical protein
MKSYHSLAKHCAAWGYHLWRKYPGSLCNFQVLLPPNSDPSCAIFSKATVLGTPGCEKLCSLVLLARGMEQPCSKDGKAVTSSRLGMSYTSSMLWCLQSSK